MADFAPAEGEPSPKRAKVEVQGRAADPHQPSPAQADSQSVPHPADSRHEQQHTTTAKPEAVSTASTSLGAYSQRERHSQRLEDSGAIKFEYVQNDGNPASLVRLVGLKNVFTKQLPNMPKEYVARLVLDRRHRSVTISSGTCTVLGGVTYRPFHSQRFGEIAFCAVSANEQVKGFGTRLMNYTKELARSRDGLEFFLTYADNAAVGYFEKQGFSTEVSQPKERWQGWIKDYDSVTLMECRIDPLLPHTRLPDLFARQRAALQLRIAAHSHSQVVRPGLLAGSQPVEVADIPGVKEAGWRAEEEQPPPYRLLLDRVPQPVGPVPLSRFMQSALARLMTDEDAWPFLDPVSAEEVPDYHTIIKDPIDLGTIRKRVLDGSYYRTLSLFTADVRHICQNARIYNATDTVYYKMADKLEALYDSHLNSHLLIDSSITKA